MKCKQYLSAFFMMLGVFLGFGISSAHAALDVSDVTTALGSVASATVPAIGIATLAIVVAIIGFKYVRRAIF